MGMEYLGGRNLNEELGNPVAPPRARRRYLSERVTLPSRGFLATLGIVLLFSGGVYYCAREAEKKAEMEMRKYTERIDKQIRETRVNPEDENK